MNVYTVSEKNTVVGSVRAQSHQDAADKWARKSYGRTAEAMLVQGEAGKSGCFQAYKPTRGGGQNSVGGNFNVRD